MVSSIASLRAIQQALVYELLMMLLITITIDKQTSIKCI